MIHAPEAPLAFASPESFNAWHIGAFLLFAAIRNGVNSSLFFACVSIFLFSSSSFTTSMSIRTISTLPFSHAK